ncbi:MAG: hypothetical protein ABWZ40_05645 [Caulobacterales bacterium]
MYDTQRVLASIDRNMWSVLALCGMAMILNYTWFFAAVLRGFRDQTVPIPVFCTLFWLCGDGSMVLRYDHWFNDIGHWYVKLFWLALVFTVACELVFLYMTLRFGRKEMAPSLTQPQFVAVVLGGLVTMAIAWELIKSLMGDELYINYFHLANLVGPVTGAAMVLRRGTQAGTSTLIWGAYTGMVACWVTACALGYGPVFATPLFIALYVVCTLSAAAVTYIVSRLPKVDAPASSSLNASGLAAAT